MKKTIMAALCCAAALTATAQANYQMNVNMKDGSVVTYHVEEVESVTFEARHEEPQPDSESTYRINIPSQFADNDVLRVMTADGQVAELCREYINTAGERLTVVYPLGSDGRADLSRGWCADNGGTIVWDAETNTCTYTPGNAAAASTVFLCNGTFSTEAAEAVSTTLEPDLIVDRRGDEEHTYRTVKIGTQYWMAQNLNATKYRNGQDVTFITTASTAQWRQNTNGAYHVFADDDSFREAYGPLYNGYALDNAAGLAPAGWDIPELTDYQRLKSYLGNASGLKMKSDAIAAWNAAASEGYEPDNLSGFSALAAGYYMVSGDGDYGLGTDAWFWTRTEYTDPLTGIGLNTVRLNYATKALTIYTESAHARATFGHSVRCIRR